MHGTLIYRVTPLQGLIMQMYESLIKTDVNYISPRDARTEGGGRSTSVFPSLPIVVAVSNASEFFSVFERTLLVSENPSIGGRNCTLFSTIFKWEKLKKRLPRSHNTSHNVVRYFTFIIYILFIIFFIQYGKEILSTYVWKNDLYEYKWKKYLIPRGRFWCSHSPPCFDYRKPSLSKRRVRSETGRAIESCELNRRTFPRLDRNRWKRKNLNFIITAELSSKMSMTSIKFLFRRFFRY